MSLEVHPNSEHMKLGSRDKASTELRMEKHAAFTAQEANLKAKDL